jgi:hypothetical protein
MPHKKEAVGETIWGHRKRWRRMTGVGCFGKPSTLINMLQRVMAQYERGTGRMDEPRARPSPVDCETRQLMKRLSLECYASNGVPGAFDAQEGRVTGFFFYMEQDRVRITVYTQESGILRLRSD